MSKKAIRPGSAMTAQNPQSGSATLSTDLENARVPTIGDVNLERPRDEVYLFPDHLGQALHLIRVQKRIRQSELAEILSQGPDKVSQSYVSKVEKGKTVSISQLVRFCKGLECTPSSVISCAEFLAYQSRRPPMAVLKDIRSRIKEKIQA